MSYIFFDDNGSFKAGTVLSSTDSTMQVGLSTGKRVKVKRAKVYLEFERPDAATFLVESQSEAELIDPQFLWEASPEGEFGFEEMASEYFGEGASPVEKGAILIRLQGSPVHFHRKGRGRFKAAPEEILRRALEAVEKRRRLEERRREMAAMMVRGEVPDEIARDPVGLLVNPDKNGIEWKALSDASAELRKSPLRVLLALGAVKSPWTWLVESFNRENFPGGAEPPADFPAPGEGLGEGLALSDAEPFSIDDSSTTEIDDATSVTRLEGGRTRIGIHIAAPSLAVARDGRADLFFRGRMSSVYAPGLKTTMMPESWVKAFSLDEGRIVPCLSLYTVVEDETMRVVSTDTRLERVRMAENIRYDKWDGEVTGESLESGTARIPRASEIACLWRFAKARLAEREEARGKPEVRGKIDWFFELEGEGEDARISVKGRRRGEPLDLVVAECMIFANCVWGLWLEEHATAGIYRCQRMGRVRMTSAGGPHDGLGVPRYAWCTSPLRRYVDLVNQAQIVAAVEGRRPPFERNDVDFFTIIARFEDLYGVYRDFQTRMERYWSLRWIMQEGLSRVGGVVVKGDLVRIDGIPFVQRVPGLPELPRGRIVLLDVVGIDLVDLVLEVRLREVRDEVVELAEEEEPEPAGKPEVKPSEEALVPVGDTGEASVGQASGESPEEDGGAAPS